MSDSVLMTLIIVGGAVTLGIVAIFFLKDRLGAATVKASKTGLQVNMQAEQQPVSSVSGNKIKGHGNVLNAPNASQVNNNQVEGDKNKLTGQ